MRKDRSQGWIDIHEFDVSKPIDIPFIKWWIDTHSDFMDCRIIKYLLQDWDIQNRKEDEDD